MNNRSLCCSPHTILYVYIHTYAHKRRNMKNVIGSTNSSHNNKSIFINMTSFNSCRCPGPPPFLLLRLGRLGQFHAAAVTDQPRHAEQHTVAVAVVALDGRPVRTVRVARSIDASGAHQSHHAQQESRLRHVVLVHLLLVLHLLTHLLGRTSVHRVRQPLHHHLQPAVLPAVLLPARLVKKINGAWWNERCLDTVSRRLCPSLPRW